MNAAGAESYEYEFEVVEGGASTRRKADAGTRQRIADDLEAYCRPHKLSAASLEKDKGAYGVAKRVFDVVCATLALVVLSPLILLVMLAIYIEDPHGSPIFTQDRVGKNGRVFRFYKLRSMCCNAEAMLDSLMKENEVDGKAFKMENDPRITKVGHFIRNTSIDELLQLVNIIKGDMSIVGPRPPLPREVALYDEYEQQRLAVTPGLTCFWQVLPKRHEVSFDDWIALDIKYIEKRSALVDIKLIFATVGRIFGGHMD